MKPSADTVVTGPHGPYFSFAQPLRFRGEDFAPSEEEPFAYRWYDKDRMVLGRRMEDQLRLSACYWHSLVASGTDPFGDATFARPWHRGRDTLEHAMHKADVAFEMFQVLGVPFFTFHDRDIAPEGRTLAQSNDNVRRIADIFEEKMSRTGVRLLWGTANLFSHPRYMAGAATNPDPDVFAYAAAQVRIALEVTHRLGGANYVLWGGREGYETLLNTDLRRELQQMGRFLSMVVEHKHKIGFKGQILIEPKPAEPTKHQYDFDVATVHGFLRMHGLEREVKLNIEQNHALLAGHTFEHEIALAQALGLFGSLDMNRGDELLGWDTDQFPHDVQQVALALYQVLHGGGIGEGGLNFDARLRRQSTEPDDLVWAHATAMDICARALLVAEKMVLDGALQRHVDGRYAGWEGERGRAILDGRLSLEDLSREVEQRSLEPKPRSGRQERLEYLVASYL
jgi:xylose isomerase